jgi:hypothetical protein
MSPIVAHVAEYHLKVSDQQGFRGPLPIDAFITLALACLCSLASNARIWVLFCDLRESDDTQTTPVPGAVH